MPFRRYVEAVRSHWRSQAGTPENTYVPSLLSFLEATVPVGNVTPWPRGNEQGLPDGGLRINSIVEGFVEAEKIRQPLDKNKTGLKQARRYSKEAPTLLTNFHEFRIFDQGREVRRYEFLREELLSTPIDVVVERHHEGLSDLVKDWSQRRTPITGAEALAERLADYARVALKRVEKSRAASLVPLKKAMEDALGYSFDGKKGQHFFESSVVQALFYGLFSGWVHAARQGQARRLTIGNVAEYLDVPLVANLFEELTVASRMKDIGLGEPVDWALEALQRVVPDPFLKAFDEGNAVQYFYEPFLAKFDPRLRKELGVWFTPREIVRYQVERTDALLKDHLGIADGLIDDRVIVLDPAAGTGSYLVEIGRFMAEKLEGDPLAGSKIKKAFRERIFGFEILPAPFVIAHLQVGLLVSDAGAPFGADQRAAIFLTNSLIGWSADRKEHPIPVWPQFAKERELADDVKHSESILVFIGNPPYDRFSSVPKVEEEVELVKPYKECLQQSWDVGKNTLNDLYIRFLRLAEVRISQSSPRRGIISYITNRSYLTGLSHPVMREHLLSNFDRVLVDDLHGSVGASRPNDGNVFTTAASAGVKVGVAVSHFVVGPDPHKGSAKVEYREFSQGSGEQKRAELLRGTTRYSSPFQPKREHRFVFRSLRGDAEYLDWHRLVDLFPVRYSGVQASRDNGPMRFESQRQQLRDQMRSYFDPSLSSAEIRDRYPELMRDGARYRARESRERALREARYRSDRVVPYMYRPFDRRILYWEEVGKLLVEKRADFFRQVFEGNRFILANQKNERATNYDRYFASSNLVEFHALRADARAFPLKVRFSSLYTSNEFDYLPNLADFYDELAKFKLLTAPKKKANCASYPRPEPILPCFGITVMSSGGKPTSEAVQASEDIFFFALAILGAPGYATDHSDYLGEDWPRIPLPSSREALASGAALGRRLYTLMDPFSAATDVLEGYESIAQLQGEVPSTFAFSDKFLPRGDGLRIGDGIRLGHVPVELLSYTVGGYPVLEQWWNARLGEELDVAELSWFVQIIRRVAAIRDLQADLDKNYSAAISS